MPTRRVEITLILDEDEDYIWDDTTVRQWLRDSLDKDGNADVLAIARVYFPDGTWFDESFEEGG